MSNNKNNAQDGQNELTFDGPTIEPKEVIENADESVTIVFDKAKAERFLEEVEKVNQSIQAQPEPNPIEYKTPNLVRAINQVTKEVRNIEKNTQVGEGRFAFNAVSDKDVKFQIGQAMERAGLAIVPIGIEPTTTVNTWEETFNGNVKRKREVFTEVRTKYALIHESGEQIEVAGYGHGVDSMDKSAGKSTTYALKYALLYLFMVPTGKIDDAENTKPQAQTKRKQTLNDAQFQKALEAIDAGKYTEDALKADYALNEAQLEKLKK